MVGIPGLLEIISRPENYIPNYPLYRWYRGVVEDVEDPEKRGRVKVRVEHVWKSENSEDDKSANIQLDDIPWADIMVIGQGNKSGFVYVPEKGTAVMVGFLHGHEQQPLVVGGWFGEVKNGDKTEPELPIAAQGGDQTDETGNDVKGKDSMTNALGTQIDEPANPYDAEYPNNIVFRTRTGHLIELDNTEGAERINITHKSGTWVEFHPDGKLVVGIQDARYTVVETDDSLHVKGNRDVVIDGDSTFKTYNHTEEIGGDANKTVVGADIVDADSIDMSATGSINVTSPDTTLEGDTTLNLLSNGTMKLGKDPTGDVVTTLTHPLDYITGIPINGVPTIQAG